MLETIHIENCSSDKEYQEAWERLKSVLKSTGRIYLNPLPKQEAFSPADANERALGIREIHNWCSIIEEFVAQGLDTAKTKNLFRYYFDRLGLYVDPSFTELIRDGDVVEIYSMDFKRLFFNPELFDYSSYAPDEMFSAPFWKLYDRDEAITLKIQELVHLFISGEKKAPFVPDIPRHLVTEIKSEKQYSCEVDIKVLAPVYLGRALVGAAAIEKLKLVLS